VTVQTVSVEPPAAAAESGARGAALLRWLDRASDRLSPIVVKEVRQIVRGREFNYSVMGSLIVGLIVAFFGAATASAGTGGTGQAVFTALTACLALIGIVIVPIGAFSALRNERLEQTMDLITVTSLSARKVVIGKLLAQAVKLATLFAGMAPFVATSFLLGGIDFISIVVSLALVFFLSLWVCAAALMVSSLARSRGMSGVLLIGGGFALVLFLGGLQILSAVMMSLLGGRGGISAFGIGFAPGGPQGWWILAMLTTLGAASLVNLVLLAENRLSSAVDDKTTALRIGFLAQFLAIIGLFCALAWFGPSSVPAPVGPMLVLCFVHLALVAAFTVSEDFAVSRRVLRRMQTTAWWRPLAAFLWPGAGRGAVYVLVQMALLLLATWSLATRPLHLHVALAGCGYILFFTGGPTVVLRRLRPGATSFVVRIAILVLVSASLVLPDVLYYFFARPETLSLTFADRHLFNPFRTLVNWNRVESFAVPQIIGFFGVLAYLAIMAMNWRATRTVDLPDTDFNHDRGA
jgi:hypothetical protein